jgi:cyclic pyranopterin phosphate synthase
MKALVDNFGRRIEYLRLSVTDRCDLRCNYCMPEDHHDFAEPENWLTFDETVQVVRVFASMGLHRLRITGGEPLVRRNVTELVSRLNRIDGIDDLSLSTNATRLEKMAGQLKEAGISRINVSLDTLDKDRYREITRGKLDKALAGLAKAREVGLSPVKVNMVVMAGVNDDEIERMVEFCASNDFTLRMIETMPQGDTGRKSTQAFVDLQKVERALVKKFNMVPAVKSGGGPARYLKMRNSDTTIGFITPLSQHFCETCNRVRMSVEGTLYLCLGQEDKVELRPLLRNGISDRQLEKVLVDAIAKKPERHEFREQPGKIVRFMSVTGG